MSSGIQKFRRDDKEAEISAPVTVYGGINGGLKLAVSWVHINGRRAYAATSEDLARDWLIRQGFFPFYG